MRESWTDARLDDLNEKVDRGFARMDARFERVDSKFDKVDEKFERINERFDQINEKFEALHRLLVQGGVLIVAALIGLIATQL